MRWMSSKQTQNRLSKIHKYTNTEAVRTLKCASRWTRNGKSTACKIFFSLSVCSTCFKRTTCEEARQTKNKEKKVSDVGGKTIDPIDAEKRKKRKKWTWQCSYLLFIENFHGKVPPGFRATFPLNEHHPAKRASAERFDALVIVEGGCVGARSVPFPFKVFFCFLEKLLNCKTRERQIIIISWVHFFNAMAILAVFRSVRIMLGRLVRDKRQFKRQGKEKGKNFCHLVNR